MADEIKVDKLMEDLVFKGSAEREVVYQGIRWTLRTLTMTDYREAMAMANVVTDEIVRTGQLHVEILVRALIAVNDVPCSRAKAEDVLNRLPMDMVTELYGRYAELEREQLDAIRYVERIQALVNDRFARIRYKVMRATGALPSEQRVKDMNDVQWMYMYLNLLEDLKDDDKLVTSRMDYLAQFVNPELFQRYKECEQANAGGKSGVIKPNVEVNENAGYIRTERGTRVNAQFDELLKEAMGDDPITELGDDVHKGNPYESADDFIARAMKVEKVARVETARILRERAEAEKMKTSTSAEPDVDVVMEDDET